MSYDGTLRFDTKIDTAGMQKDGAKLAGIVKGLGLFEMIKSGMSMVANSVGDAVARVDTLERFPKVLMQIENSAEDAAAATQKLSDGVQGLPTTLDSVISTAQRITILTGNLEEATDTTLALNNAFLASQATTQDAERGLVQYVQMLSKGSVDIVSWRTLQETMGYALMEVAESFGYAGRAAQNDLYAALSSGDITFEQLNSRMVELNEGVGGFAELAQTASGGIVTSWTNIKTALVRGSADIITAVDDGMESVGGISGAMDNIKGSVTTSFKVISGGTKVFMQNLDKLGVAATGVVAAFAAHKGITAWSTASNTAQTVAGNLKNTQEKLTLSVKKDNVERLKQIATAKTKAATDAAERAQMLKTIAIQKQAQAAELSSSAAKASGAQASALKTKADAASVVAQKADTAATTASVAAETASTVAVNANTAAQNAQNTSVGLGTALVGYLTGAFTFQTVATAAATVATTVFSIALNALPMIAIITAIGLLVAGLGALATRSAEANKEMNDVKESIASAKEAMDEINSTFSASVDEASASAIAAHKLVDEMAGLEAQSKLTAAQQARYAQMAGQLNELMPSLNAEIDNQTGFLLGGANAWRDNIEAQKEYFIQQAFIKKNTELYKSYGDAVVALNDALGMQEKNTSRQSEIYDELAKATGQSREEVERLVQIMGYDALRGFALANGASEELAYSYDDLARKAYGLSLEQNKLDEVVEEATDVQNGYTEEITESEAALNTYTEKTGVAETATEELAESTTTAGKTVAEAYEHMEKAQKESVDSMLGTFETMTGGLAGLSEEIKMDDETTWAAIQKTQDDTIDKTLQFSSLYAQLIKQGVSESYLEAIDAAGPESIPLLKEMLDSGIDTVLQKQGEWQTAFGNIAATATDAFQLDAGTSAAIQEYILGESGVMGTMQSAISEADFASLGVAASEGFVEGVSTLPEAAQDVGEQARESMAKGLGNSDAASNAATQVVTATKTAASNAVTTADFPSVGKNISEGMAQGIRDGESSVINAIVELTTAAIQTAMSGLDEHSPSKLFRNEIGLMVSRGFALGIQDGIPEAEKAAQELADSVYKTASEAIAEQKYYGKLTLKDELAIYKRLVVEFKDYAEIRKQISRDIHRVEQELRKESYKKYKETIDAKVKHQNLSLQQQLKEWERVQKKYKKGTEERVAAEKAAASVQEEIYKKAIDLEEQYQLALGKRTQEILKAYQLFEKIPDAKEITGEELLDNLQGQVDATKTWAADLAELQRRGINEGLLSELQKMGPKASSEISALLRLTAEQLTQYSNLYGEKQRVANEQAQKELENLRKQTDLELAALLGDSTLRLRHQAPVVGKEWVNGIGSGIESRLPYLLKKIEAMGKKIVSTTKKSLNFKAGSTLLRDEIGFALSSGLAQDIAAYTTQVSAASGQINAGYSVDGDSRLYGLRTQSPLANEFLSLPGEAIKQYAQQSYAAAMANQAAMTKAPALSLVSGEGASVVNNNTFNQTINSDKYMSPADNARTANAFWRRKDWQIK